MSSLCGQNLSVFLQQTLTHIIARSFFYTSLVYLGVGQLQYIPGHLYCRQASVHIQVLPVWTAIGSYNMVKIFSNRSALSVGCC
jgi:hypothetical protein